MNHFCVDHPSTSKKAGTRTAPRSAKKRSAAVSATPAQAPSKQATRPTSKRSTAKSSGKRRQVFATMAADPSADHAVAPSKTSNKQTRNTTSRGEKTEHPSRDEKAHPRSRSPHQKPPAVQHADFRCELCEKRHRAERCTSYSSVEERRQRAQYLWLCFTCLARDHRTETCSNVGMFSCAFCDYDVHHQALCAAALRHATKAAEAVSTPVVVPAEADQQRLTPRTDLHQSDSSTSLQPSTAQAVPTALAEDPQQEPTMAEDRRALQRQNREPKK